jgi:WD40 repeat protein
VDGRVRLWDSTTKKLKTFLPMQLPVFGTVVYSPDGKRLATELAVVRTPLQVWVIKTGRVTKSFKAADQSSLRAWGWCADSQTMAVGGKNEVVLWDAISGDTRSTLSFPQGFVCVPMVLVSGDGQTIAASGFPFNPNTTLDANGMLKVWRQGSSTGQPSKSSNPESTK